MATGGVRIDGLNAVVRGLIAIGFEVDDLKDSFSAIAARGARAAAQFAPKRLGTLAGDVRGSRARSKAVITAGRKSVPYAGPINYGWAAHNITANGFMQKADKVIQPWALKQLERDINRQIARRGLR
jgi:hypothetical protein